MAPLSRRALLGSAAAVGAGGALGLLPVNVHARWPPRRPRARSPRSSTCSS
ncbi:MAG TPA: twin-arginine translocation signal domain-containing protein [Actinospica sp.]|nr:twin-arginine translocation signal domain-containing protein [Actinospica sp.]